MTAGQSDLQYCNKHQVPLTLIDCQCCGGLGETEIWLDDITTTFGICRCCNGSGDDSVCELCQDDDDTE